MTVVTLTLTDFQTQFLEKTSRRRSISKRIVDRATIVLKVNAGCPKRVLSREMAVNILTVRKWCKRFSKAADSLREMENALQQTDAPAKAKREYERAILAVFEDRWRCGAPMKFSAEQVTHIVAIACEVLDDSDQAVSHRTQNEIAEEAQRCGIVDSVSQKTVCRFLKSGSR